MRPLLSLLPSSVAFHHRIGLSISEAADWLERLTDWSASSASSRYLICADESFYEMLTEVDLFPTVRNLDEALSQSGLTPLVSAVDVHRIITTLLQRAVWAPEGAEKIVLPPDPTALPGYACECHPALNTWDDYWLSEGPLLAEGRSQALVLTAAPSIQRGAWVSMADPTRSGRLFLLAHMDDVRAVLDVADYLTAATVSVEDLRFAVRCAAQQTAGVNSDIIPPFSATPQFMDDLAGCHRFGGPERVTMGLRGLVEILWDVDVRQRHALRVSAGGSAAQREDSGWRAWRHMLGDGWRIHFWKRSNEYILGRFQAHDNFDIPPVTLAM